VQLQPVNAQKTALSMSAVKVDRRYINKLSCYP